MAVWSENMNLFTAHYIYKIIPFASVIIKKKKMDRDNKLKAQCSSDNSQIWL